MDLASVTPASISADQMALMQESAGMLVLRKVIDLQASEGAMLVQMENQSAGLGRTMDISA
jgi:hypothetical protein